MLILCLSDGKKINKHGFVFYHDNDTASIAIVPPNIK